jgi:hypothetical protein
MLCPDHASPAYDRESFEQRIYKKEMLVLDGYTLALRCDKTAKLSYYGCFLYYNTVFIKD